MTHRIGQLLLLLKKCPTNFSLSLFPGGISCRSPRQTSVCRTFLTLRFGFFISLVLLAASLLLLTQAKVTAQEGKGPQQEPMPKPSGPEVIRDSSGRVSIKLERGGKVSVGNRSTGPIAVVGWDRDVIEAIATSDRGSEIVRVGVDSGPAGTRISLKADYAERGAGGEWTWPIESFRQEANAQVKEFLQELGRQRRAFGLLSSEKPPDSDAGPFITPPSSQGKVITPPIAPASPLPGQAPVKPSGAPAKPPRSDFRPGEIFLEVRVPRYAELELIEVVKSDVLVAGVETAVTVSGDKSTIKLKNIGAAEVKTHSGDVEVESANGLIDVITTGGSILVKNAGGDVRALSLNGRIEIQCARGRVDASNTDGPITLAGIGGDASATTTSSRVSFTGAIRADGRYYLKSMSGAVEMVVPTNSPGFTATLSSYRGNIDTDIPLKTKKPSPKSSVNHRLIGSYGNGQAQITLDSFDGAVRLGKMTTNALKDCK